MLAAMCSLPPAPANRHSRFLVDPAQIEFKPPSPHSPRLSPARFLRRPGHENIVARDGSLASRYDIRNLQP